VLLIHSFFVWLKKLFIKNHAFFELILLLLDFIKLLITFSTLLLFIFSEELFHCYWYSDLL